MVFKMIAARKEADIKYQAFLDNDKVDVNFAKHWVGLLADG